MKKFVSALLSLVTLFTLATPAFAATSSNSSPIEILTNNDDLCIAVEHTDEGITIATNNKQTGILVVEKYDINGETLISSQTFDISAIDASVKNDKPFTPIQRERPLEEHSQYTFSNREYYMAVYRDRIYWSIRSGDNEKTMYENSSNADTLDKFRAAVEDVNSAELILIAEVGLVAIPTIIATLLTAGTTAAAAIAGTAGAGAALINLNACINNADYYYSRAKA